MVKYITLENWLSICQSIAFYITLCYSRFKIRSREETIVSGIQRIVTALVAKFLPSKTLVDTHAVPVNLPYDVLHEAAKLYHANVSSPDDVRGLVVQLHYSDNPAFSSLKPLASRLVRDNSLSMEAECLSALGQIMAQIGCRLKEMVEQGQAR